MFNYLVIDDDDANREALSKGLQGFCDTGELMAASNARDAQEILEDYIPDVILLDVVMPFTDGLETLKRIRFDKRFDDSVILMMSSIMLDHVASAAMLNKADYCLWKPVNIRMLRECVYGILAARQCDLCPFNAIDEGTKMICRIRDQLDNLGVPISCQGYELLRLAIQIMCEREQTTRALTTDEVYNRVARAYSITPSRVERNIRNAIKLAWESDPQRVSQGLYANKKPKACEFIAKVTQIVTQAGW